LVADAAKKLGLSPRTVWRLAKKHAQHDSIAKLIPQTSGRKPGAKVLDADVEVIIAGKIDSFYLSEESPTVKELHCRIAAECRKSGLSVPHVRSVARRVARRSDEQSLARRVGAKAAKYAARAMPGHVDVSKPLERVEIDHTPMDVIVKSDDPMCGYVGRPWLSMAIDVYSRVILGFLISFESPSSLSVALCLVHSMVQKNPEVEFGVPLDWPMYGKPKEIVVDNAREFDSVTLRRGCAEHGIILTYRPIGSPHFGGAIERLVGTMMGKCHLLPGTTKRSVAARGDYDAVKHACMTLSELRTWFAEQVLGNYHISEHRGLRVLPLVAWQRALGGHNE
jgi:putative transposase